jgi:hypothetical protein
VFLGLPALGLGCSDDGAGDVGADSARAVANFVTAANNMIGLACPAPDPTDKVPTPCTATFTCNVAGTAYVDGTTLYKGSHLLAPSMFLSFLGCADSRVQAGDTFDGETNFESDYDGSMAVLMVQGARVRTSGTDGGIGWAQVSATLEMTAAQETLTGTLDGDIIAGAWRVSN